MILERVKSLLLSWAEKVKKYKYTAIILILGIVLMCIPFKPIEKESEAVHNITTEQEVQTEKLQKDLEIILK